MIEQLDKKIEQIYTKCLAQGSYFIESNGEAAVIDPLRETDPYLERAAEKGVKIKYIFETHFHADFVSGHLSLAKKTGATIVYGPGAETEYEKYNAADGEEFEIGNLTITALHTPGHTPESTSFLLKNELGKEEAIFSGDTLFIGDVGRPDLAQKATGLTVEDLAGDLYDSLRNKIMPLPDDIIVYPAHGAGSACGKSMRKETFDTLGNQKKTNYALEKGMDKATFITTLLDGLENPPAYFSENVRINKKGYLDFDQVLQKGNNGLAPSDFFALSQTKDVMVLDVREKWAFAQNHIPNSINVGIDGSFAPWVGEIIEDINQRIIIVAPEGREKEVITRLARVGYDNCIAYLNSSIEVYGKEGYVLAHYNTLSVESLEEIYNPSLHIIDFRKTTEFNDGHIVNAKNIPLSEIYTRIEELDKDRDYIVHCRSGYRSTIASSIMLSKGYKITNLIAVFDDIMESTIDTQAL